MNTANDDIRAREAAMVAKLCEVDARIAQLTGHPLRTYGETRRVEVMMSESSPKK